MNSYILTRMLYYLRYGVWYTEEEIKLYERLDDIKRELSDLRSKGFNLNFLRRISLIREKKKILDKIEEINNKQVNDTTELF